MVISYSYEDFSKIQEKPGCYCICLDWSRIRKSDFENNKQKRIDLVNAIFKVYSPNPILINASRLFFDKKQNFGESYSGPIYADEIRVVKLPSLIVENYQTFEAFLNTLQTIGIPLYIGKSKNLNRRLKTHIEYLSSHRLGNDAELDNNDKEKFKNFSDRFSNTLNECKNLGLRTAMISARVIYLEESDISEFESFLNYLYKPHFGLR